LERTKATDLLAGLLTLGSAHLPAFLALALILVTAMLVTPLMHHAAAVLVMGPVAATMANGLGYNTDPFLMAVALGASCDFLTPIGDGTRGISFRRFLAPWPAAVDHGNRAGHTIDPVELAAALRVAAARSGWSYRPHLVGTGTLKSSGAADQSIPGSGGKLYVVLSLTTVSDGIFPLHERCRWYCVP
jgi:hypothetical protein